MDDQKTGGQAFPRYGNDPWGKPSNYCAGMTLRDYFAAKALDTITAYNSQDVELWEPHDFARHAYQIADAMLAARNT